MATYIIEGGNRLTGEITISGNKNSVLPCIAACLLSDKEVTLTNVPDISDVAVFVDILTKIGVSVERREKTLTVKAVGITSSSLPKELITRLRASILLIGPILARFGTVEFSHPGGDIIGKRSIETHIEGLKSLGFTFERNDRDYTGKTAKTPVSVREFFLDEPSVTATENLIIAASYGSGETILKNCAMEPHVVDLCNLLVKMGVKITGIGSTTLIIKATKSFKSCEFAIGQEFMEIGTYAVAAALTGGEITLKNCSLQDLEPMVLPFQKMGIIFDQTPGGVKVSANAIQSIPKLQVRPWPGFPSDLMSIAIVLSTQAKGVSLMHDWMYESRMFFVDKIINMGAHITIADPHRVLVYGPNKLFGRELETPDIRAGMALVLAALIAQGKSVINKAELIERGYENVVENLKKLGASIQRLD